MNFISVWRLRKKWKHAQKIHDEEHETKIPRSLSCVAVGHVWSDFDNSIDDYQDYFDSDAQRKFLREYREISFK